MAELTIRPEEIRGALDAFVQSYEPGAASREEVGRVADAGDGIAHVEGLPSVMTQELLEFAFIFQCDGVAGASVQDILGCNAKTARDLQTEIARLEPWQVIARSEEKTEEFVKFTAEAFYKTYS